MFNMTSSQSIGARPAGGANAERCRPWQPVTRTCHVATASMPLVSAPREMPNEPHGSKSLRSRGAIGTRTHKTHRRWEIRTFDDAVSWTSWEREQEANVSLALLSHLSTNENKTDRRNHADWGDFPQRASNHITHHDDPGRYIQALPGRRERSDLPREHRTALDMIRGAIQTPSFSADHAGMPSRTRECMPSPRHQPACAFPRARGRCCSKRPPNSDKRRRR